MSRPTRHDCGCTSTDRAWVTMCDKHRAEHAELHARAANEHDAQERTDARVTAVATPKAGVNPEGCDRPSGLYTAQVQP